CDAFFASVEQALHPELKGRPVVTGKERGIAAAMSYEAKARGITRGMRLFEIRRVCPEAVILPSDYETYSLISERLMTILRRFTPQVEAFSIDEAFADLSGLRRLHRTSYEGIARRMQETAQEELGIGISAGLGPTKTLAKICSKEKKPRGFCCVRGYELQNFLPNIPVGRVSGIGPASVALLEKYGVRTAWDYVNRPLFQIKKLLGKVGAELWHELRGEAVYSVIESGAVPPASISKAKTFTPPSEKRAFVMAQALRNTESAFIKLRRHGLRTGMIGVMLRDKDYCSQALAADLRYPTAATQEAASVVSRIVGELFRAGTRYRQTTVFLARFSAASERQGDLFEDSARVRQLERLSVCVDEVNRAYGKHCLHLASTTPVDGFGKHLGERGDRPGRLEGLLPGETARQRIGIPLWDLRI
ncbi:MAG: DNA polymerase IV, partial [Candidatus Omnitrophica bacterium]|nr:DNA polymerase IV [Candidatus Omnitrophota bacterium]